MAATGVDIYVTYIKSHNVANIGGQLDWLFRIPNNVYVCCFVSEIGRPKNVNRDEQNRNKGGD